MILEEGKIYTNSQLAEWFEVKPATFTKSKQKKLADIRIWLTFCFIYNNLLAIFWFIKRYII